MARTLTPKRAYAAVVLISDRVGFLRFFFMNKFSGDSWMYPYQRTPTGNPYIRVCMGYFIPKNPQRTPAKYHGHVRYGYTRPCPLKFSMEEAWMKKISFLKHHLPSKQNYLFCDCENDVSGSIWQRQLFIRSLLLLSWATPTKPWHDIPWNPDWFMTGSLL